MRVPLVSETEVPEDVYEEVGPPFSEEELVDLTWAMVMINGWNWMSVAFRAQPGNDRPSR